MKNTEFMKNKIKISKKALFIFLISLVLITKSNTVLAEVKSTAGDRGLMIEIGGFIGGDEYARNEWNGGKICTSDSRISGFCEDIKNTCEAECLGAECPGEKPYQSPCHKAIMGVYDKKMKDILQAEMDAKISSAGLDKDKANTALEACGGDLSCIDKMLANLQKDASYLEDNTTNNTFEGPLTAATLSDLINSNSSSEGVGPINGADNDPAGLLNKQQGPKVDVTFGSTGIMQQGAKVTATAVASFFNNASDPKDLYYTWYLKRKNCDLKSSGVSVDDSCNMDGDDKITVNDWKIAAAKIIVAGSFDKSQANYSGSVDSAAAAFKAVPEFSKTENGNNIGWKKGFLRDNDGKIFEENENDDEVTNCYVQAPTSGRMYELRKTEPTFENSCPENFHRVCVSDQTATCDVINPLYSATNTSVSKTITSEFKACAVSSVESNDSCVVKNEDALKNFKAAVVCGNGALPLCVKNDSSNLEFKDNSSKVLGVIVGTVPGIVNEADNNKKKCSAVAKPDLVNSTAIDKLFLAGNANFTEENEKCSTLQKNIINGSKDDLGKVVITGNASLAPKCGFKKDANLCKHLFPKLPEEIKKDDGKQAVVGDGEFNIAEKKFWGADPTKASTTGNGKDEERAVGLGVDKFEWMFSPGDQVGVVVEGDSVFSTEHADASFKRMWAFSKGKCDKLENIEDVDVAGFYVEGDSDLKNGILTTEADLDDCLKDNLLEPDGEGLSELAIQLNASPANPINDPSGRGDVLTVSSNAINLQNPDGLLYKWSVQKSKDGSTAPMDTTSWIDVTDDMIAGGAFSAADKEGLAKNELAINLNMSDSVVKKDIAANKYNGVFYLRVKVKITGTAADGGQDTEGITLPLRIKQQENEMHVYPVTATDTGMLNLNKGLSGQPLELCSDQQGRIRCYVAKNSIIGLEVPDAGNNGLSNFSWKVNGNDIACSPNVSSDCITGGNRLFVPILGNEGEAVDVTATAVNEKNESIEVSRHFVIGSTQLQIMSFDSNAWPKLLGYYKDMTSGGNCSQGGVGCYADVSTQVLEASEGSTVTLGVQGQSGYEWAIDGQVIPVFRDKNQIRLSIDKVAGESYNIGLSTRLLPGGTSQLNNVRKALYRNWGVAPEEAVEENQSANIQLNVVASPSQSVASAEQTTFGASLITHLPEQFMFLLKIILTAFTLLASTGLLFALMPESQFRRTE